MTKNREHSDLRPQLSHCFEDGSDPDSDGLTSFCPELRAPWDGQPLARGESGISLPGFTIWRPFARGATATLYLALDNTLKRQVALKILHSETLLLGGGAELFLEEARNLARVRHPNVVRVYSYHEHKGLIGISMEYIQGKDLRELIDRRGPLTEVDCVLLGIDICRGLAAAHTEGILHRDVKPANVMREVDGRFVLLDFSLLVVGTPIYMAPELWQDGSDCLHTVASDIYSSGVTLYVAATGRAPYTKTSQSALRHQVRTGEVAPLFERRKDLSAGFVGIVEKAMATNPTARFQSAHEMEHALCGLIGGRRCRAARAGLSGAPLPVSRLSPAGA